MCLEDALLNHSDVVEVVLLDESMNIMAAIQRLCSLFGYGKVYFLVNEGHSVSISAVAYAYTVVLRQLY